MHKIDVPSATPDGEFTEGSPTGGVPATTVSADWLNDVQGELLSILAAASVAPIKGNETQVLESLNKMFAGFLDQQALLGPAGWFSIPVMVAGIKRKVVVQWGSVSVAVNSTAVATLPVAYLNQHMQAVGSYDNPIGAIFPTFAVGSLNLGNLTIGVKAASGTNFVIRYFSIGW